MATALPRQRVEAALDRLKKDIKSWAARLYHKKMPVTKDGEVQMSREWYRLGSKTFGRRHPEIAVTDEDRRRMVLLKAEGCSFREIEDIFHIRPQNGNGAQRCIREIAKAVATGSRPTPRSRMSSDKVFRYFETLKKENPTEAKQILWKIEGLFPAEQKKRARQPREAVAG